MAIKLTIPKAPPAPVMPSEIAPDLTLVHEHYPKIGDKIALMWGSSVLQQYLSKIIFDERGGRQGFPMPVVSALMRIYEYHGTLVPEPKAGDDWEQVV